MPENQADRKNVGRHFPDAVIGLNDPLPDVQRRVAAPRERRWSRLRVLVDAQGGRGELRATLRFESA